MRSENPSSQMLHVDSGSVAERNKMDEQTPKHRCGGKAWEAWVFPPSKRVEEPDRVWFCGLKARGTQDHHSVLKGEPQTQASPLGRWVSRCGGSEGLAGLERAMK